MLPSPVKDKVNEHLELQRYFVVNQDLFRIDYLNPSNVFFILNVNVNSGEEFTSSLAEAFVISLL